MGDTANATATFTAADLTKMAAEVTKQAIQAIQAAPAPAPAPPPALTAPRVGGKTKKGIWTGTGNPSNPSQPRSRACYRTLVQGVGSRDPFTAESAIEETCKEGLSN